VDEAPRSGLIRLLFWMVLVVSVLYGTVELLVAAGVLGLCIVGGIATRSLPLALFGVVGDLALIGYGAVVARQRRV
jgi:hypothetical protein